MTTRGKELVVSRQELAEPDSDESIARIEAMADELPALIEAGDAETLKRWRNEGRAAYLAAKRLGYLREADTLARQTIRCSASVGVVMGRRGESEAPGIDRLNLAPKCRMLGAAMERNVLEAVLDACDAPVHEDQAHAVASRMGVNWVRRDVLKRLILKRCKERKCSIGMLARELGLPEHELYHITARRRAGEQHRWWMAWPVIEALGLKASDLALAPNSRPSTKPSYSHKKWLTHRFNPAGGKWDEVAVRYTKMRDEMRRAQEDWVNKPILYEAMRTISDIIQREIRSAESKSAKERRDLEDAGRQMPEREVRASRVPKHG